MMICNEGRHCPLCTDTCESFIEVEPLRHGRWIVNTESSDGYEHHMCSVCKTYAIHNYMYDDDYDELPDGGYRYIGRIESGIFERMTMFCPNCGAKMDMEG